MRTIGVIVAVLACLRVTAADPKACKAGEFDDHVKKGNDAFTAANYAAALTEFESALTCKPDDSPTLKRAFMAACEAKNADHAKRWYGKLAANDQQQILQICLKNGIDPRK